MRASVVQRRMFDRLSQVYVSYRDSSLAVHDEPYGWWPRSRLKAGDRAPDVSFQDFANGKVITLFARKLGADSPRCGNPRLFSGNALAPWAADDPEGQTRLVAFCGMADAAVTHVVEGRSPALRFPRRAVRAGGRAGGTTTFVLLRTQGAARRLGRVTASHWILSPGAGYRCAALLRQSR